jgi:hypothetical protein
MLVLFLGLMLVLLWVLFLGMGCKGRGQFPFPCVHVEKNSSCIMPTHLVWTFVPATAR